MLKIAVANALLGLLLGTRANVFALMLFGPVILIEIGLAASADATLSDLALLAVVATVAAEIGYLVGSALKPVPAPRRRTEIKAPTLPPDVAP